MTSTSVPRVGDKELIKIFIEKTLVKWDELGLSEDAKCSIYIAGYPVHFGADGEGDGPELIEGLLSGPQSSSSVTAITLTSSSIGQMSIKYIRSPDKFIDTLEVSRGHNAVTSGAATLFNHVNRLLLEHASPLFDKQSDSSLEVASVHHEVLARLEGMSGQLLEDLAKRSQDIEKEKQDYLEDLRKEYERKEREQANTYQRKLEKLDEQALRREEELNAWEKTLEDADNTTTRRKTTTKTLEDAQEKAKGFNFSNNVTVKTAISALIVVILALIGGYLAFVSYVELSIKSSAYSMYLSSMASGEAVATQPPLVDDMSKQFIYFLYLRVAAGSVLMVSSLLYLVRWFNSWANRIAQQELDNQIFIRDLNRAHLAVEMSLEWNEKKDGEIPPRLLESMTEGLFKSQEAANCEVQHPVDQLAAALVRTSDKITYPLGTGTLETSGKNVRKAKPPKPQ